jgi:hypothetical protein
MRKRGQFYLIAAMIVILIFSGLAIVYTRVSSNDEGVSLIDLSEEIYFEGNKLIDNRVFSDRSGEIVEDLKLYFVDYYENKYSNIDFALYYDDGIDINEITGLGINVVSSDEVYDDCELDEVKNFCVYLIKEISGEVITGVK